MRLNLEFLGQGLIEGEFLGISWQGGTFWGWRFTDGGCQDLVIAAWPNLHTKDRPILWFGMQLTGDAAFDEKRWFSIVDDIYEIGMEWPAFHEWLLDNHPWVLPDHVANGPFMGMLDRWLA